MSSPPCPIPPSLSNANEVNLRKTIFTLLLAFVSSNAAAEEIFPNKEQNAVSLMHSVTGPAS